MSATSHPHAAPIGVHPVSAGTTWRQLALCVGMDPDLFFPGKGAPPRAVRDACARCPALIPCTFDALRHPVEGYQAGLSKNERDRIRAWDRKQRARAAR